MTDQQADHDGEYQPHTREHIQRLMAATVLAHVPDNTPVPAARELVELLTDLVMVAAKELAEWEAPAAHIGRNGPPQ